MALWSGEEQGLLGSKAWVSPAPGGRRAIRAARDKIRRVLQHRQRHRADLRVVPAEQRSRSAAIFDPWLEPLKAFGARRNVIEPVGSTDHLSFTDVGVPGFNPIQDYVNYDIRTHHTNMDTVDRLDVKDISQAAIVMAWYAYNTSMADGKIPRPAAK